MVKIKERESTEDLLKKVSEESAKRALEEYTESEIETKGGGTSKIRQIIKEAKETGHFGYSESADCPTCGIHSHKLKNSGYQKVKCSGDKCGVEYALVPGNSDYKCTTCGLPHKKPAKEIEDDKCPFCNSNEFIQYDWGKIKSKVAKKTEKDKSKKKE